VPTNQQDSGRAWMTGTSPAMTQVVEFKEIVMPGLVQGIHVFLAFRADARSG